MDRPTSSGATPPAPAGRERNRASPMRRNRRLAALLAIASLLPAPLLLGPPDARAWMAAEEVGGGSVRVDAAGNVYVSGWTSFDSWRYTDAFLVKYDPNGVRVYIFTYAHSACSQGICNWHFIDAGGPLALDAAGNVYWGLKTAGASIRSYTPSGALRWADATYHSVEAMEADEAGLVYVLNESLIRMFNPDGSLVWWWPAYLMGYDISAFALGFGGEVFLTGSDGDYPRNYVTVALDGAGNELWTRWYDGPASLDDEAVDVAGDAAGNVYVTGWSREQNENGEENFVTVKYSPAGDPLWTAVYDGPAHWADRPVALRVDAAGCVYVTGTVSVDGTHGFEDDYGTVKYDPAGNLLWEALYDTGGYEDEPEAMVLRDPGFVCVTGQGSLGYQTVMYDTESGFLVWEGHYQGGQWPTSAYDITVDAAGSVYVTGSAGWEHPQDHAVTIKYPSCVSAADCDDGNPCTDDPCISGLCAYEANAGPCDDGDPCTMNDTCTSYWRCVGDPLDEDGDAYISDACGGEDCDDADPEVHPGAAEACANGIDDDCDGQVDTADPACVCQDGDGDGYGDPAFPGCPYPEGDCDDEDPAVHPGAEEICGNGIDDDCDGAVDDEDGDCEAYPGPANAEAAVFGSSSVAGSGVCNGLTLLLLVPLTAVFVLRIRRRNR